jgi:hypothetical protein
MPRGAARAVNPQAPACSAALRPDGDRAAFRGRGRGAGRRAFPARFRRAAPRRTKGFARSVRLKPNGADACRPSSGQRRQNYPSNRTPRPPAGVSAVGHKRPSALQKKDRGKLPPARCNIDRARGAHVRGCELLRDPRVIRAVLHYRPQCIIGTQKHDISKVRRNTFVLRRFRRSVTLTSDCVTPVRRADSLGNLSHKPSLNLWMPNLPACELGDDLDVLIMSDIPDICVPIMH